MKLHLRNIFFLMLVISVPMACVEDDGGESLTIIDDNAANGSENGANSTNQGNNDTNNTNNDNNTNNTNNDDPNNGTTNNDDPNNSNNNDNNNNTNNDTNNDTNNNNDPSEPANDGSACQEDSDCLSNTCLNDSDWPQGYCTTVSCSSFEDCANDDYDENKCLVNNQGGSNFCVRMCNPSGPDTCRENYQCQGLAGGTEGWCAPIAGSGDSPSGNEPEMLPMQCVNTSGSQTTFDYEISPNTTSYMVIPMTGNGESLWPVRITTPSGEILNFQGANYFQAVGAQLFGVINPTVVPAIEEFSGQLESGTHSYTVQTDDSELCYYLIENTGTPSVIDLNIYLVGLPGISASNANTDPDMQEVVDNAEDLYQQIGISFGEVRFYDVPSEAEQNYSVIHSESDVRNLASYSEAPGDDNDNMLSANLFLTQEFAMGGALGISLGIPGVAGLHGSTISGVALTGEYIGTTSGWSGDGNQYTANILAHELGHFLGLFHTSEQTGDTHDPVSDTAECTNFSNPTDCPDWGNLMFPSAAGGNTDISTGQGYMIHSNPLTK